MSERTQAPSTASVTAWASTSPSEVALTPIASETVTPPMMRGGSPSRGCASNPHPTRVPASGTQWPADTSSFLVGFDFGQGPVQPLDGLLLVDLEAEGQLGAEGETRLGKHSLQCRADALGL